MGDHPLFLSRFSFLPFSHLTSGSGFNLLSFAAQSGDWCKLTSAMAIERDERPWGRFEVLAEGEGYKVKRIEVMPGHRLSLQMHQDRSEHWVIVAGEALVTLGEQVMRLCANEDLLIPAKTRHRVANTRDVKLVFIEIQCGSYLGEDDITRFEDDYSRALPEPGENGSEFR